MATNNKQHNRRSIHSEKKHSCYKNVKRFYVENESNRIESYCKCAFISYFRVVLPIVCTAHTKHCGFFMRIFTFSFQWPMLKTKEYVRFGIFGLAWLLIDEKSVYSLNCTKKSCFFFVFHLLFLDLLWILGLSSSAMFGCTQFIFFFCYSFFFFSLSAFSSYSPVFSPYRSADKLFRELFICYSKCLLKMRWCRHFVSNILKTIKS